MLGEYEIVRGSVRDWELFRRYHYRTDKRLYFVDKVYLFLHIYGEVRRKVGIVVYTYPKANCRMRDEVLSDYYLHFDKGLKMTVLNRECRRLSRIVIAPSYRGAGLGTKLVRVTMPMVGVRFIDTVAKMGRWSGFLERAGMAKVGEEENYYLWKREREKKLGARSEKREGRGKR